MIFRMIIRGRDCACTANRQLIMRLMNKDENEIEKLRRNELIKWD
jgi:hypothetical protein